MSSQTGRIRAGIANAGPPVTDPLPGPDAQAVADLSMQVWTDIHEVLSPIIGDAGVVALYQRSLHLSRAAHPGLAFVPAVHAESPWQGLPATLSAMPVPEALAAADDLVRTFCDLLATLIGPALTARLLGSVPNLPSSGTAAPEASP